MTVESSRERSTGTSEALLLAAAGSPARAYLVTSYSMDSRSSTPSTCTCPVALVSRRRGSGPESMESLATLVPERSSPRDLHTRNAATARSISNRTARRKRREGARARPSRVGPVLAERPGVSSGSGRRGSSSPWTLTWGALRSRWLHAAIDILQADDVVLVARAEGDLQYADVPLTYR